MRAAAGIALIRQMANGDRNAFDDFYNTYATLAYRLIVRIVRDHDDAAEVLQDVFWSAWEAAATYDSARGTPEAWIITRARSRAIDRVRSLRRRSQSSIIPLVSEAMKRLSEPFEPGRGTADRLSVKTALESLTADQREVLKLAYYAGFTQTEIAALLNEPLGTIKARMRRGLERLRKMMGTRDA